MFWLFMLDLHAASNHVNDVMLENMWYDAKYSIEIVLSCMDLPFSFDLLQGKMGPKGNPGKTGEPGPPGQAGLPTLYLWKNTAEEWAAFQVRW